LIEKTLHDQVSLILKWYASCGFGLLTIYIYRKKEIYASSLDE